MSNNPEKLVLNLKNKGIEVTKLKSHWRMADLGYQLGWIWNQLSCLPHRWRILQLGKPTWNVSGTYGCSHIDGSLREKLCFSSHWLHILLVSAFTATATPRLLHSLSESRTQPPRVSGMDQTSLQESSGPSAPAWYCWDFQSCGSNCHPGLHLFSLKIAIVRQVKSVPWKTV